MVVGNGNVAIDVARILVHSPDHLATTDIADHALAVLRRSRVRRVTLLGRRGPAQASFTNPELREFGRLDGISAQVDAAELEIDAASEAEIADNAVRKRNMNTLRGYAEAVPGDGEAVPAGGDRVVRFRFLVSPVEVVGEDGRVCAVRVERNRLVEREGGYLSAEGHRRDGDAAVRDADSLRGIPGRSGAGRSLRRAHRDRAERGGAACWRVPVARRSSRASTWWGGRSGVRRV